MLRTAIVSLLAMLLLGGAVIAAEAIPIPAPAPVTLSFASDDNDDGPTFRGVSSGQLPNDLIDASAMSLDGLVNVDLMVDKNGDAAGGVVVVPAYFFFVGDISNFNRTSTTGGWFIQWDVNGSFTFLDAATGGTLLTVSFGNALLTTYSPSPGTLGQTAGLQSSNDVDASLTMTATSLFTTRTGVSTQSFGTSEDFAFTFTNLRNIDGGGGLPMIDHGVFLRNWASEGSFSAHAAPGLIAEEEPKDPQ